MLETTIYALTDPRDGAIKYVGKSVNLKRRMKSHRSAQGKHRCGAWLRKLKEKGLRCNHKVLEVVVGEGWEERERYWISYYRSMGADLCNLSTGGEGGFGRELSEESKEKLRNAFKGRPIPQEQRERISNALKGLKHSPETIEKRKEAIRQSRIARGLPVGEDCHTRELEKRRSQRRAQGMVARNSDDFRRQAAEKQKAYIDSLTPEEKAAHYAKHHGRPAWNKGMKLEPQSEDRRKLQSENMKAYLAQMAPEQRAQRMLAAQQARKAKAA